MFRHRIAVIAAEGITGLNAADWKFGQEFQWDEPPWSCEYYPQHGRMMPKDPLKRIRSHNAIFLVAAGFAGVPDYAFLWSLSIAIRRGFQQYANIRHVRLMPGIESPQQDRGAGDIDFGIVPENNDGEFSSSSGISFEGTDDEVVIRNGGFTRRGTDHFLRYKFKLAHAPPHRRLTSATKLNGEFVSMPSWDGCFRQMAVRYPDVMTDKNGRDRDRLVGQPKPRARILIDVRAGPRFGSGFLRSRYCQPRGSSLVQGDAAEAPWPPGGRERDRDGHQARAAHADIGGTARTQ